MEPSVAPEAGAGLDRPSCGTLAGGLPYNHLGSGPPAVVLQGLTFESRALSRLETRFAMAPYRPLARAHSIYVVNRRPGLPRGTSLGQMAADYASMIRVEFGPPVDVIGLSSGGSIALHLAAEHPDVVRRLVIQDCGCRQTDAGRVWGRTVVRLAEDGDWRAIAEMMMGLVQPENAFGRGLVRLFSPLLARSAPKDPADMIALLEAEDGYDFSPRLGEISASTLVASGEFDPFCGAVVARETAAGLLHGQAIVYQGQRHGLRGAAFERDLVDFLDGAG